MNLPLHDSARWSHRRRHLRARGFTLVELGAVVTIVGILAVLAVVGYRRMITASHSAEATHMISAIRQAQESYRAETGGYAAVSGSATSSIAVTGSGGHSCTSTTTMYPTSAVGNKKTAWGAACGAACPTAGITWDSIPVHLDGPVMYGYTTVANLAGVKADDISGMIRNGTTYSITFPGASQTTTDWFVVGACGDPNGDGTYSSYVSSSFSNQIFESNDGE